MQAKVPSLETCMSKLRDWLMAKDLASLAEVFEREQIDWDALLVLSVDDLKDLGLPIGLRAKLQAALQALRSEKVPQEMASALPKVAETPSSAIGGERRQLTAFFCDMVGFTKLATSLDPEILHRIVRQFKDCCEMCIARYEGYIFQFLGDCVVAFFGYPFAHEGEAERAIHAGLQIIQLLENQEFAEAGQLSVRIGIATGVVVIAPGGKGAVGETMNLAARLQGIAQPGDVVISERVQRLACGNFVYQDLGEQHLKGLSQPLRAYRIVGVSKAASRFEAATQQGLTPLIGRSQEIALLMERWDRAKQGEGQVMVISGAPGIGKSRLINTLHDHVMSMDGRGLSFQCSPYNIASTLWPIRNYLERMLMFSRLESAEAKLAKLEAMVVGQYGLPLEDVAFIASMLSIPCGERFAEDSMTPQRRKREVLRSLVNLCEAATRRRPMLMLFEDVQWADPTTLEVVDLLIERARALPMLIVLTHRTDFRSRWQDYEYVSELKLCRLTRLESAALVARLAGGKTLPESLLEQILSRTDGVPLYVEELTRAVLESDQLIEQNQSYTYKNSDEEITIPATLRGLLMARLDRSMAAKELAQTGAAIGRVFSHDLLAAVTTLTATQLSNALVQLIDSGLAIKLDTSPQALYEFRHALLQEVAYDSLLKSSRQALHGRIAGVIEEEFPNIVIHEPEVLARHLTAAGLSEAAILRWRDAGELALKRMALSEAISHFNQGLRLLPKISASSERDRTELALRRMMGVAWMAAKGWPTAEARECLLPALKLTASAKTGREILPVYWGLFSNTLSQGRVADSLQWAEELLAKGVESGDGEILITAHLMMTVSHFWLGELMTCRAHIMAVMKLYDPVRHRPIADVINHDPLTGAGVYRAQVSWMLGYPDRAVVECDAKDAHALSRGHVFDRGFALCAGADVFEYRGEPEAQRQRVKASELLARQNSLSVLSEILVPLRMGASLVRAGQVGEGVRLLRGGLHLREACGGFGGSNPYLKMLMAEGMALDDDGAGALQVIEELIEQIERPGWGERCHYAEIRRLEGWLFERRDDLEAAEASYRLSLDWARTQQARSWELRTSTSLAQLLLRLGRRDEAQELLIPIYGWFTEGFGTHDLITARKVIEQLS